MLEAESREQAVKQGLDIMKAVEWQLNYMAGRLERLIPLVVGDETLNDMLANNPYAMADALVSLYFEIAKPLETKLDKDVMSKLVERYKRAEERGFQLYGS